MAVLRGPGKVFQRLLLGNRQFRGHFVHLHQFVLGLIQFFWSWLLSGLYKTDNGNKYATESTNPDTIKRITTAIFRFVSRISIWPRARIVTSRIIVEGAKVVLQLLHL